jgi:hypothetical protein
MQKEKLNMRYHYTYLSVDVSDNRMYIGSRSCKCEPQKDSSYFGSFTDKTFNPSIKKILKLFRSREEAFKHEIYLHFVLDVANNPKFANKARATSDGFTWTGQKHTKETIEKIRQASKNISKQTRETIRQKQLGKKLTPEHIEALRQSNLGKPKSIETRNKISNKAKGRTCKKSTRLKISQHNKGKWLNRKDQSKPITLQNTITKEVKHFASQKEAVRCLGVQQASLNRVALGKQKSCKNWILFIDLN